MTADDSVFGVLVERHRQELRAHCYRMLDSFDEAEDLVQETFLRAWRARASFKGEVAGGSAFRAWLYRIATNACWDVLRRRDPRRTGQHNPTRPPRWLVEVASADAQPDEVVVARETLELAVMAAVQMLPPRQRAVLILRDLVGCSTPETAGLLGVTEAAVNSALQRGRATLRRRLPGRRSDWPAAQPTSDERNVVAQVLDMTFR